MKFKVQKIIFTSSVVVILATSATISTRSAFAQSVISEFDFSDGIPSDWAIEDNREEGGCIWIYDESSNDPGAIASPVLDAEHEYCDTWLISPHVNTSDMDCGLYGVHLWWGFDSAEDSANAIIYQSNDDGEWFNISYWSDDFPVTPYDGSIAGYETESHGGSQFPKDVRLAFQFRNYDPDAGSMKITSVELLEWSECENPLDDDDDSHEPTDDDDAAASSGDDAGCGCGC